MDSIDRIWIILLTSTFIIQAPAVSYAGIELKMTSPPRQIINDMYGMLPDLKILILKYDFDAYKSMNEKKVEQIRKKLGEICRGRCGIGQPITASLSEDEKMMMRIIRETIYIQFQEIFKSIQDSNKTNSLKLYDELSQKLKEVRRKNKLYGGHIYIGAKRID